MFKIDDTAKACFFGMISVVLMVAIFYFTMLLMNSLRNERVAEDFKEYDNIYGTVLKRSGDYIVVKPIDEEIGDEIRVHGSEDVMEGDFILIEDETVKIIATSKDLATVVESTTTTTTEKKTSTSISRTTTKTNNMDMTTTRVTTTRKINKDEIVISYASELNDELSLASRDETLKDKAKSTFISIVDFIFYGGEIKGVTWDELSASAKAKVVYYALLIDSKIDNKWPNYKNEIGSKVNDIKAKLVAKYMDVTTNICNKYPDDCNNVRSDFQLLKNSVGITWDVVKNAFKYGYDKTTTYLKTWYEVFSGKA